MAKVSSSGKVILKSGYVLRLPQDAKGSELLEAIGQECDRAVSDARSVLIRRAAGAVLAVAVLGFWVGQTRGTDAAWRLANDKATRLWAGGACRGVNNMYLFLTAAILGEDSQQILSQLRIEEAGGSSSEEDLFIQLGNVAGGGRDARFNPDPFSAASETESALRGASEAAMAGILEGSAFEGLLDSGEGTPQWYQRGCEYVGDQPGDLRNEYLGPEGPDGPI